MENKIKILRDISKNCLNNSKLFKKKFKRLKKIDDFIDITNAILTGTSITLIVVGFSNPPCLIASAVISGIHFCISRVQDKYNLKSRYTQCNLTMQQYNDLAREINAILSKNNLTSEEYQRFIEECNDKISLIEDSQLF